MEKIRETERFYGCYWPVEGAKAAIIGMYGDDTEDFMAKSAVKWLQKTFHINVLTMSPAQKDYGHHNYPLERMEEAVKFLKERGNEKIAISGASTTGMLSLIAASYIPDITLTLALTPADFVMEGFYQGKRDGVTEWPGEGESSVSYHGKPLPYLPLCVTDILNTAEKCRRKARKERTLWHLLICSGSPRRNILFRKKSLSRWKI